ncbi:general substrate transporter [Jimgerdemannia flammicorona]|uniref:General substrate transporter n=1 Tax=Jimgerdemannia flammicorona TaxID=994334 RepID=A0A433BAQ4_9FUNG|nr:general substrate transporter [Jimgerdemannia flammicorona]
MSNQQFTGQNMIFYFAPTVFQSVGLKNNYDLLATGVVGLVKMFSSAFGIFLPDRFGRRPIMISGTTIMVVAFL